MSLLTKNQELGGKPRRLYQSTKPLTAKERLAKIRRERELREELTKEMEPKRNVNLDEILGELL